MNPEAVVVDEIVVDHESFDDEFTLGLGNVSGFLKKGQTCSTY